MRLLPLFCVVILPIVNATCSDAADQPTLTSTLWSMDETTKIGGHATTVLGQPQIIADSTSKAVHFDGVADGLLVPINPLQGLGEFTIEVLFKPESGGPAEQRFLHAQDELGNRTLMEIRMTENSWALDTFLCALSPDSKCALLDRTKLHPADRWTWVALVYANGHMTHYIDGVKELEGDVAFPPMRPGQISLGVRQNKVYWFKGSMREVRFHPSALAAEKLQRAVSK